MSDLQRSFAKAKLSSLPFNPTAPLNALTDDPGYFDEIEEEEADDGLRPLPSPSASSLEDDSSSASSASSTGTIVPSPGRKLFARGEGLSGPMSRVSPLPWTNFFAQELTVTPDHPASITHHAYLTPPATKAAPLFIMHHGAGSSALSFAAVSAEIRKAAPEAGVLAFDARGHGQTTVANPSAASKDSTLDLSLDALSGDLTRAYAAVRDKMGWEEDVNVILVGHSLGGAVAATVAKEQKLCAKVLAFAILDVVEGSAMDALQSMQGYLSTRPVSFIRVEAGIDWHLRSRTIRNSTSARVSVPALLRPRSRLDADSVLVWRTNLGATQPFWTNWFDGLSKKFLTARGGKLLLLAGTDRLDKELMIGQMQGKFALQIFPETGHFVHEDAPEKTAMVLVDFWKRNEGSRLVFPPKVSDMLARGKVE